MGVTLGKEEVVFVLGIDVGDTPLIAEDLYRCGEPGDRFFSIDLRPWASHEPGTHGGDNQDENEQHNADNYEDLAKTLHWILPSILGLQSADTGIEAE
jgi:hypothetical protein